MERYAEVIEEIIRSFDPESYITRSYAAFVRVDPEALEEQVVRDYRRCLPEQVERALSVCCDLGRPPAVEALEALAVDASHQALLLVEAQTRRALGLVKRDAEQLSSALAIFERVGAVPSAARARCERGLLIGDMAELERGMRALEALGDLEQLERYDRAKRG